jgi:hypothetical protein
MVNTMSTEKVIVHEEAPGLDYQYVIRKFRDSHNLYFWNLDQVEEFCNSRGISFEVDYYMPS